MSKIAFLFPGQGAQTVGMGEALAQALPAVRQLYTRASSILGYDLAKLCFEGPAEELDSTVYSQPALFVTSLAALEQLRHESPEVVLSCEAAAGLSLGEYTAMVFAGVFEFEDGLRLVQERGTAMQDAADATPSGMVSILGLERAQVEALCQQARRRRRAANRQPAVPGQHRGFGNQCGLRAGGRTGDQGRSDEGGAAGRGRSVSHADHAPAVERLAAALAKREDRTAQDSRWFRTSTPGRTTIRKKSGNC